MRRHFTLNCEGSLLVATLDEASGTSGLVIVTGGNETRAGAWDGQAEFAARIAAAGFPVLRFDRRGTGDSEGENGGFRSSGQDIAAAIAAFRAACPQVSRFVGFGNCDGASALMLAGGAGLDGLVLSNPWTIEDETAAPPPEAVRSHYRQRLASPAAILRLLAGKVAIGPLVRSLFAAAKAPPAPSSLAQDMAAGIAGFAGDIRFLVAERDRTGQAFLGAWNKPDSRIRRCPDATHSYVEQHARDWLMAQVLEVLRQ